MNSQYMSQQPPQYGAPPEPGYGPTQSGSGYGPPQSSNKQMPVLNQAGFQQQQPQQQQLQQQSLQMMGPQRGTTPNSTVRGNLPPAALPNTHTVPNGPAQGPPPLQSVHGMQGLQSQHGLANNLASQGLHGPTNLQGSVGAPNNQSGQFPPSQQRGSQNMPAPPPASASPNQIASQMAGMNISGPRRMNSGLPITSGKPGLVSPNIPSNSFPGAINGGPTPVQGLLAEAPPVQKSHPPGSKQYVNGSTGPSPASAGGLPMPPNGAPPTGSPASQDPGIVMPPHFSGPQSGIMTSQLGSMPPQQSNMPPHQGNMPPHPGSMPLHPGSMPLHSGNMPPHPGNMPPHPGNMPPHPGNIPPHPGNMPPQPGNMPPHPSGLPPPPGTLLPQHLGGMPPHSAGITPHSSGLSSQIGGMPPPRGSVPPQGATMPTQGGIMPPPPGSMIGMPHPGGQLQGNLPPPPGRMPFSQTGAPQSMDSYQGSIAAPPGPGGGYGSPQQPLGSSQMQSHTYSQLPSQPAHPNMQAQQARRLDPDQMPSPIQVTQDDQRNRSGIFSTGQKGQVPPLVTTDFVTQDQGNAGPRYIRSTMYNIPATIDMMKQTAVPLGLVLSPLARTVEGEYSPPIVDMGELGPVRCIRCKAYMCPFMQFIDGGRRFHCLFCKATTEVPAEYFQHLDHTGQRVDRFERPELMLGTYEFVATKDYCRNNTFPKPPALIFLIDVSYNNIKSGMVHLLCKQMKEILKLLPKDAGAEKSTMRVGFITYNNTVHFYNIKGCLAQPQMMVVGDVQDMFMPLLEGFLCDPVESEAVIDSLMDQIPAMFADTRETETVLAPAIQAGLEALKASECAGKLLVFLSSLPIAEAPGKLKNRDERKLLGTEKEKTVLAPQINTYNTLGQDCVGAGCSVDLFVFNNSYIDIATIGQVCRLTGGEIFKYTYFQADLDGERLISDIKRNVSRPIAFDAIMRVRTSTGVRATDFFGHFFMSNTTDMELASVDCDKAVAVEIKHDDKLTEEDGVYVQVALLYTSCGGQRRLRVLNLSFKTCTQMADLYRSCDLDSIVNFFSKQVVFRLLETSPKQVKDGLVNRCAQMLACYRKNCASPSSAGQLILPECMKLLPLYVNCILKSDAVSGGSDMTIDDRSFVMQAVSIMDLPSSVAYFYPRLLPLHDIDVNGNEIPAPVRCTADKIHDDGVYLLENGVHMFLWIGLNVGMDWVQNVFGVHSAAQIDIDRTALPALDNPLSQRINSLISSVRQQRHRSMRLTLVRQRDKLEMVFKHFLVEDRGFDGSASYVDFLCHMHKEIRNLLS